MKRLGITATMVIMEFLDVVLYTINKAATNTGMSNYVYVSYSKHFRFLLPPNFTLLLQSFSLALLYVVQAWVIRDFPAELMASLIRCFFASFALALRTVIHFWAFKKKWAVFVAMFKPLGNVIALVLGIIFLGETIYLGRVVGGIIVSVGFYAVIWGKA
ncbi:hypothetical protein FEM48_Zijuj10G0059200 [Ziziphus jujuba var. spinosa]|uniref:WAT1-related protein n=1 Tax=Ziziphus jujuba var. spinosa TaxID=714518 RepID=A0A978ULP6_ZIZJJ|nr:hypothetical protein FEM48_Zijuj10G0059200 [Ziziphus jujuba var. spinosa]